MKRLFHNYWQVVAVSFFTTVLALQIPRRALFFAPQSNVCESPFASFVEISPEVYGELLDKARMSWQQRARRVDNGFDSRVGEFTFSDPIPDPEYLPRLATPAPSLLEMETPTCFGHALLIPPTLALPHMSRPPKVVERPLSAGPDPELLELPDFLKNEVSL